MLGLFANEHMVACKYAKHERFSHFVDTQHITNYSAAYAPKFNHFSA